MTVTEREPPHFEPIAVERMRLAEEPGLNVGDVLLRATLWAIAGGGTIGVLYFLRLKNVATNDALSFVGAVIGAAGTVAGAAWLANAKETRERRQEQKIVLDAINDLRRKLGGLIPLLAGGEYDPKRRQVATNVIQSFMDADAAAASEYFGEVIQHAKTLNFYQRHSVKGLRQALDKYVEGISGPGGWEYHRQVALLQGVSNSADHAGRAFSSGRLTPFTSN